MERSECLGSAETATLNPKPSAPQVWFGPLYDQCSAADVRTLLAELGVNASLEA